MNQQLLEKVSFDLLELYYYLGLFEACQKILNDIKTNSNKKKIYEIAILDRLDQHEEAILEIKKDLEKNIPINDKSYELALKLILLVSYRSINKFNEVQNIFKDIKSKRSDYKNLYEYRFFLRLSDIYLGYSESISNIKESIDAFKEVNSDIYEAHSRITLTVQLTRIGKLSEALKENKIAISLLEGRTLERHINLVNQMAIKIYMDDFTINEMTTLKNKSLATIPESNSFELIAVYNNILLSYTLKHIFENIDEIIDILLKNLDLQPDKVIHRTIYYNIAYCYKIQKIDILYQQYLDKSRKVFPTHDELWNFRLFDKEIKDNNFKFLSKFPYQPTFIAYWHFDLNNIS